MAKGDSSFIKDATPLIIVGGLVYLAYRSGIFQRAGSGVSDVFEGAGTAAEGLGSGVSSGAQGIGEGVSSAFRGVGSGVGSAGRGVGSAIGDIASNVGDLTDPLGSAGRGLASWVDSFFGARRANISDAGGSSPSAVTNWIKRLNPFSAAAGIIKAPIAISNWAAATFAQKTAPSTTGNTNPIVTNNPVHVTSLNSGSGGSSSRSKTSLLTKSKANPLLQAMLNSQASMRESLNRALAISRNRGR